MNSNPRSRADAGSATRASEARHRLPASGCAQALDDQRRRHRIADDVARVQRHHAVARRQPQHVARAEALRVAGAVAAEALLSGVRIAAFVEHHLAVHRTRRGVRRSRQFGDAHAADAADAGDPQPGIAPTGTRVADVAFVEEERRIRRQALLGTERMPAASGFDKHAPGQRSDHPDARRATATPTKRRGPPAAPPGQRMDAPGHRAVAAVPTAFPAAARRRGRMRSRARAGRAVPAPARCDRAGRRPDGTGRWWWGTTGCRRDRGRSR